jgi:hypothetical protein
MILTLRFNARNKLIGLMNDGRNWNKQAIVFNHGGRTQPIFNIEFFQTRR